MLSNPGLRRSRGPSGEALAPGDFPFGSACKGSVKGALKGSFKGTLKGSLKECRF